MMKNKYIPVRKLAQITEERFKHLTNTLPWNLSREDQAEANQLRKDIQPIMNILMIDLCKKYEDLDNIFDGEDNA